MGEKKVTNWNKLSLLFWKNYRIQFCHKGQLFIDIFLPILFVVWLVKIRKLSVPTDKKAVEYREQPINLDSLWKHENEENAAPIDRMELVYSPNNEILESLVKKASSKLRPQITVAATRNADKLEKYMMVNRSIVGIQFPNSYSKLSSLPKKLTYSLRFPSEHRTKPLSSPSHWETNKLYPKLKYCGPRNRYSSDGGSPFYIREGFIAVQNAISMAFIESLATKSLEQRAVPTIVMRRFPYPLYIKDDLLLALKTFLPLIIVLSFIYPVSQATKHVTTEKRKRLKEALKIMGIKNWMHWLAWFGNCFFQMWIPVIIIVYILITTWDTNFYSALLTNSNWLLVFLFFLIYLVPVIIFCFMISTFFNKPSTAAAVSGFVFFMTYIIFQLAGDDFSSTSKFFACLFPNTAMGFAMEIILKLEILGQGLQWSNLFKPLNSQDSLTVGVIMILLLISAAIYMMIAIYFDLINLGDHGARLKWNFPFTKDYWFKNSTPAEMFDITENRSSETHHFKGIKIRNLTKRFGNKIAVNNLSMNLHENDITVLLGHNGAGKTTTISMLTGMLLPTAGTALINGYDIRTQLEEARGSIGFCPQYNVLFDELTVREHIFFFCKLKGVTDEKLDFEVYRYITKLKLLEKANTPSENLSGGMQRKLSIACALCGGSKVVFCDEPSSGLDPSARQSLWDLIISEKQNKTILLTTHYMDEADMLGDKIAIITNGVLKCFDTQFELKKKYGVGYHLVCEKKADCKTTVVTDLLEKHIPEIIPKSDIGSELSYNIPDEFSHVFEKMLKDLEENLEKLKLNSFGISITTLEEVFLQIGEDTRFKDRKSSLPYAVNYATIFSNDASMRKKDFNICQWKAMFLKKFFFTIRNYSFPLFQTLLPIMFMIITVLYTKTIDPFEPLQPLKIDMSEYRSSLSFVEIDEETAQSTGVANEYRKYLESYGEEHQVHEIDHVRDHLIGLHKYEIATMVAEYLIAATITDSKITAWFNNELLHSAPLSLNAVHNSILRSLFPQKSSYYIEVSNYPLPFNEKSKLAAMEREDINARFGIATNFSFSLAFVSGFYILFVIRERETRSKLLQFVSGVRVYIFWLSQLIFDQITFWIIIFITTLMMSIFQIEGFSNFLELGRVFLVSLCFSISVIPFLYLFSYLYIDPANGFTKMQIISIFTGFGIYVTVKILRLDVIKDKHVGDFLDGIFIIFPYYAYTKSICDLMKRASAEYYCEQFCKNIWPDDLPCSMKILCEYGRPFKSCCLSNYLDWHEPGVGRNIFYMLLVAIICLVFIFIIDYQLMKKCLTKIKTLLRPKKCLTTHSDADEDVLNEIDTIDKMSSKDFESYNLVVRRLAKYYSKFLAVDQISFLVQHSECFGLLGVNGAGKTTTFKMLTGDTAISCGDAFVRGYSVENNINKVYQLIGYCPQFDSLLDSLTGREILTVFGLLRGLPKKNFDIILDEIALALGFFAYIDKCVQSYSGGNKRKLNTAIALLGNPAIIYLDEPTCGMDPSSRRKFWNVISRIRDYGKSIVLTTHSMEECEALCTRMAIMVGGRFVCLGSSQHLKNKFATGFILKVKIQKPKRDSINEDSTTEYDPFDIEDLYKVKDFIEKEFPQAKLKKYYQGIFTYYIPVTEMKWSTIFGILQRNINELNLEDYSVSQTTLDEIFLQIAQNFESS